MKFLPLEIEGAFLIQLTSFEDERGFFARTFCRETFIENGLNPALEQCSLSYNRKRGTLRGMHYQTAPHTETKLVSCQQGAIYDVLIDLRPRSPSYMKWIAVELTDKEHSILYVPAEVAHGFQTLADDVSVFYQISSAYVPAASRGVRYNDPAFGIQWPLPVSVLSEKDRNYPDYHPELLFPSNQ